MTDHAKQIMQLANAEAARLDHEYIGAEHILWAIVETGGPAAQTLAAFGASPEAIHGRLGEVLNSNSEKARFGPEQTPRARHLIERAHQERGNEHRPVDEFDLLIGLILDPESIGTHILASFGITVERVRASRGKVPITILVQPGIDAANLQHEIDLVRQNTGISDPVDALKAACDAVRSIKSHTAIARLLSEAF